MSSVRGPEPLSYRRIERSGFSALETLALGDGSRFIEPLPVILDFVRTGLAHRLVGIEAAGTLVGFYVVHPDRRDSSCWWLGWLAVDARCQGSGIGRAAMAVVMAGLRRVVGCRRVRLLVDPANAPGLRLYRTAGFRVVGEWADTGELIMEAGQPGPRAASLAHQAAPSALTLVLAMCLRLWRRGMPPAARLSGEFHGPPAPTLAIT